MKKLLGQISLSFLLLFVSNPVFSLEHERTNPGSREVIRLNRMLNETCLTSMLRNKVKVYSLGSTNSGCFLAGCFICLPLDCMGS